MPDILKFTLLGACYFCIPISLRFVLGGGNLLGTALYLLSPAFKIFLGGLEQSLV